MTYEHLKTGFVKERPTKNLWAVRGLLCLLLGIATVVAFTGCGGQVDEAHDSIAEWVDNHPWDADVPVGLMPVFRNPFHALSPDFAIYEGLSANALSVEVLTAIAEELMETLEVEIDRIDIVNNTHMPNPYAVWPARVEARGENVIVTAVGDGSVHIAFPDGFPLPEGISLSWYEERYGDRQKAIQYLSERFAPMLGIPLIDPEQDTRSIVDRVLDYHFNNIHFISNAQGDLRSMERYALRDMVLIDKVGYFPIITPEEAIARMLDGQGSFGVDMGQPLPAAEDVLDIRVVYFGHSLGRQFLEVFIPWYQLTVRSLYVDYLQAYFVPALATPYVEANPTWVVYPHQ